LPHSWLTETTPRNPARSSTTLKPGQPSTAEDTTKALDEEGSSKVDRRDTNLNIVDRKRTSAIGDVSEKNQSSFKLSKAVSEDKDGKPVTNLAKKKPGSDSYVLSRFDLSNLSVKALASGNKKLVDEIEAELKRRDAAQDFLEDEEVDIAEEAK